MSFPSEDESVGSFVLLVLSSSSSLVLPLAGFTYKSITPALPEANTILLPSGDQIGAKSQEGSKVNLVGVLRAISVSQMWKLPFSARSTATMFSSGESQIE